MRLGEDHNWWVDEVSDPVHWDVDALSIDADTLRAEVGNVLLVADNGTHAIAPTLYGAKLSYDVFRDFTPITLAATFPAVIVLHPSVQATTAQEFVALARSRASNPLTFASWQISAP